MHEYTIASSIVETLADLANKQGSSKVLEVHMRIGKLRALSTEQLTFSYNILTKGTALEGSKLSIEEATGRVRCPQCNYSKEFDPSGDPSFHFAIPSQACPECNTALNIEGGDECIITSVRMVVPTSEEPMVPTSGSM